VLKVASLKAGGRDGTLVVVSRDLQRAVRVPDVQTLQEALDHWKDVSSVLRLLYHQLNQGLLNDSISLNL